MSAPIDKARELLGELQDKEREVLAESMRMAEIFDRSFETLGIVELMDFVESVKSEYESLTVDFVGGSWFVAMDGGGVGKRHPTLAEALRAELISQRELLKRFLAEDMNRFGNDEKAR